MLGGFDAKLDGSIVIGMSTKIKTAFVSWGAATYLGSGYADQSQFAAQTGLRFKF